MPRDGSGIYTVPPGTAGIPDTPILSAKYNNYTNDVAADLNYPRPINSGGTGASTVAQAQTNLGIVPVSGGGTISGSLTITGGPLTVPAPVNPTDAASKSYVDSLSAVRYDISQTLTSAQQVQAQQNMYAAPFDAMAYCGMQVNGSCDVSQESGANTQAVAINAQKYIVDGWQVGTNNVAMTAQQTTAAPPGYTHAVIASVSTANPSPAAANYAMFFLNIEGYRVARLAFGLASASPISIGFWVKANRLGQYSGALRNQGTNRSCTFTFTVAASQVWQFVAVTLPGDITGTWFTDNSLGLQLSICMMLGTNYQGAPGAWLAGNYIGAPGCVNGVAATTDNIAITGLIVLPGIELPSAARAPFIMRSFDQELQICKRYYEKTLPYATPAQNGTGLTGSELNCLPPNGTTQLVNAMWDFEVEKRANPTCTLLNPRSGGAVGCWTTGSADLGNPTLTAPLSTTRVRPADGTGSPGGANYYVNCVADARL